MAALSLRNVTKSFNETDVIKGVSLDIDKGEFVVFVGPSGCGKSTLLRMIAGLDHATSGEIAIDGKIVNEVEPSRRGIAMVFQSYALYPHKTVFDNMAFGLQIERRPKAEIEQRVTAAARILHMEELLRRKPGQLSGGQRQRVAIGRAIVRQPKVFLFDEPLSNLDAALRVDMRMELAKLHRDLGATMIYVTHDQTEAMTLADRIVVLKDGVVQQVGSPMELYENPANRFVAGFIGSPRMNFLPAEVIAVADGGATLRLFDREVTVSKTADWSVGQAVTLGIRPHDLVLCETGSEMLTGDIRLVERVGTETIVSLDCGQSAVSAAFPGRTAIDDNQPLRLTFDPARVAIFA
ncbi:MAG: sn-glycerol-3-phosphate ABC transporter ATP-binding protein UgpC [Candidatus Devosia phytovorans]|uniref:Sn-glycerol-3-phosphate ABC transporter ATP-binding protein UgpC n=1 Tax=Candidatus Devosia phytovorans TaxID=3121372 RepID=A0AAJ5VQJ2_9HYPH|nr:sn-glycerol-3-phosphate ABC transporter ATP-binding protein UgpC [Devosia sp.]WEK02906.1 MAG: sn-glycerol-3-phosphate ABC transporter ATP-binding protein UgpC [Devosia sp.]